MKLSSFFVAFGGILLMGANFAVAQVVRFDLIPYALGANDQSPDGRFVVGEADWNGDGFVDGSYLWDFVTHTVIDLENTVDPTTSVPAVAVSDDGSVVLGTIADPNDPENPLGNVAGIWRASTQSWESLGYLPNAGYCPGRSSGYELSADGSVAVGLSWDGCNAHAVRWTESTGMVSLQLLANGSNRASVVSADGNVIAGFAQGQFDRTPAVWSSDGTGITLDPTAAAQGEIFGINAAGTILLGEWTSTSSAPRACKWTAGPSGWTRTQIGAGSSLPGWSGEPLDIADDGTIVGFDFLSGYRRAWLQPQGAGAIIDLKTYIQSHGGTVPTGMTLEVCQAISRDGRFIIGHGFYTGAWRVTILSDCPGDLTGDRTVDLGDLAQMLAAYGHCAGDAGFDSRADIDGSLCVDLSDLSSLLSHYGATCP